MSNEIDNNALLGELFVGTNEEIMKADEAPSAFSKIEESGVYMVKITMAKQVDSKSSGSKDFAIEMETEDGAKLFWKAGWYIGQDGTIKDSKGNIKFQAVNLAKINYLITGQESLPVLELANIKETVWVDNKPTEQTNPRNICKGMIDQFVKVQVIRIRSNKQVDSGAVKDGYAVYVDGPDEKFTNEVKKFYVGTTDQTTAEKKLNAPATIIKKDLEYCEKHPVLDKFKQVAVAPAGAPAGGATTGFGSAPVQNATAGFGA